MKVFLSVMKSSSRPFEIWGLTIRSCAADYKASPNPKSGLAKSRDMVTSSSPEATLRPMKETMIIGNHRRIVFIKMAQPVPVSGQPTGSPESGTDQGASGATGQLTACRNPLSKDVMLHHSRISAEYSLVPRYPP